MTRIWILLGSLAVLAGCAMPTPYQAQNEGRWGYSESRIENNRFRVAFSGNSLTDRETVETYLLYRSAELTLESGYDYFTVVRRATDVDRRLRASGFNDAPYYNGFHVHYSYFHPRWGWRGWHDPFWDDVNYREVTRYDASAEIVLGRGEKPQNDPQAFDASEVTANLGEQIVRPEPG